MGFFKKALGSTDENVMTNGILGRGEITNLSMSSLTMQTNNRLVERKCTISMNVMLDNTPAFPATAEQRIPEIYLPQLVPGAAVPVRVAPEDHSKVYIDFNAKIPTITLPRMTGENSGAYLREHGKPVKVVLVANQPLKFKTPDGIDLQYLTLTVYEGVDTPYQVQVANPVPASALPLLYPGSKLHAKLGNNKDSVMVCWEEGAVT